ncbi:MAG TPA: hypothetical protein VD767_09365 [Thermomicrobiales bacterium]|nr:hypothetical protein [Thermomicrobiales bacterium]
MNSPSEPAPRFEDLSRSPRIRTLAYDVHAIAAIAAELGAAASLAPFRLPSSEVWQLTVDGNQGRPQVMLTLWPGIHRVDVIAGPTTVVFTDVEVIDLVPGVEVQFRRRNRELLVVALGGKVIVRA